MRKNCKVKLYESKFKKRQRRKAKVVLVIFLSILVAAFAYVFCVVNPIVVEATRHMVFSLSTSAVSDAIYDVLNEENVTYDDLVDVTYDNEGNVSLISLQTVRLNLIARKFYQVAQVYLDNMGKKGIDVALGTFTGLPFLSGVGPKINLKLVSIGAMTSTFQSSFASAGINQTNHSVYIHLYASVSMILPAYTATIDSVTEMLVAESVIVGKVPQVYLGSNSSLNFTPTASNVET
ncbi:MAG: sporulation protein YunB [Clostridia bacterium]|nr:sporulation protein YunB [Clostridia bacterium]